MSFIFKCPYCQQPMNCEDDGDGLEAQCPKCDKDVTLRKKAVPILRPAPQPEQSPSTVAPSEGTPVSQPPSQPTAEVPADPDFLFICPECGSPAVLSADKQGKAHTCPFCGEDVIALPSTTRKCPFCGETIKLAAAICKSCRKPVPPIMPQSSAAFEGGAAAPGGAERNNGPVTTGPSASNVTRKSSPMPMSNSRPGEQRFSLSFVPGRCLVGEQSQ